MKQTRRTVAARIGVRRLEPLEHRVAIVSCILLCLLIAPPDAGAQTASVTVRGQPQTVHLYPAGAPTSLVILSSGDLGWSGFVVDVAEFLKDQNVAVFGFNTKAYLESFTRGAQRLDPAQVPADYQTLGREAARLLNVNGAPVLVGISEGAGLSVIAASDPAVRGSFRGVIGLGLPARIELGWRAWRDWTIWITKGQPKEPQADIADYIARVAPLPLVSIQSTHDEFVPRETATALFDAARDPKRIYFIEARNHRFSDKRDDLHARLLEALRFVAEAESYARTGHHGVHHPALS